MNAETQCITLLTVPRYLQQLRAAKATGAAVFTRDGGSRTIYYKFGEIISASSTIADDRMETCLLRAGRISPEQHDASVEIAEARKKQVAAVLVECGFLSPPDLVAAAELQVREIVQGLLSWREGRFSFDETAVLPDDVVSLPLDTGALLLQGVRAAEWRDVRKALPPLDTLLRPAGEQAGMRGLALEQDEQDVLALIDGRTTIADLCVQSGLGDFNTLRIIYVLLALHAVEEGAAPSGMRHRDTDDDTALRREQERMLADAVASPAKARELIEQAYAVSGDQDHYAILGIAPDAPLADIKKAYFRLAKLYHPDRHNDPAFADLQEKLETLFVGINEAYTVLTSREKRAAYDAAPALRTKKKRDEARARETGSDGQQHIAATKFSEGMKQYQEGNFWGAEEAFRWSVRIDPRNPGYAFHLGLALSRIPRRGREAEEWLRKAVELDPAKVDHHRELANFYRKNGLAAKALITLRDAVKRHPDAEALRDDLQQLEGTMKHPEK